MYAYEHTSMLRRIMRDSGSWPGMWLIYKPTIRHLDRAVYRMSKGRETFTSWVTGLPVIQLTTTGRKSGRRRTTPLVALPHGEAFTVIASNFGQKSNPAWYYNLKAQPSVTIGVDGRTREMVARELEGDERVAWFEKGVEIYPGWTSYRERTAPHRKIPVIELAPAASDAEGTGSRDD